MEPILFVVHCPTCGAKLAVHDRLLLGQLTPCPKCAGMVLIEDPASHARSLESTADTAPAGPIPPSPIPVETTFPNTDAPPGFGPRTEFVLPESLPAASTLSQTLTPENLVLGDSVDTLPEQLGVIDTSDARMVNETGEHDNIENAGNLGGLPAPPVVTAATETNRPPRQMELPPQPAQSAENLVSDTEDAPDDEDFDDEDFDEENDDFEEEPDTAPDAEGPDDSQETTPIWHSPLFLTGLLLAAMLLLTCTLFIVFRPNSETSQEISPDSPPENGAAAAVETPQTAENTKTADTPQVIDSAQTVESESPAEAPEGGAQLTQTPAEMPPMEEPTDGFDPRGSGVDLTDHDPAEEPSAPPETVLEPTETPEIAPEQAKAPEPAPLPPGENPPGEIESAAAEEPITVEPTLDAGLAEPLDIARRLAIPVRSIQFKDKTLAEIVAMLTGLTGVPILPDFAAIDHFPALNARRIALSLESTTAGAILDEAARQFDLTVRTEPDQILLVPKSAEPVETVFELSDLISQTAGARAANLPEAFAIRALSPELTAERIAEIAADLFELKNLSAETSAPAATAVESNMAETNTAPASTDEENLSESPRPQESAAPTGTVRVEGTTLVVCASAKMLYDVQRFLEQLRSLRRLELQTALAPEELIPETLGFEQLSEPMTLGFLTPVTLREALAVFGSATKRRVLLDEAALRLAGLSPETRTGFRADSLPAARVLTELLAGYGLTWTTPAVDLILVTTKEAAGRISTVEIYLYASMENLSADEAQSTNSAAVRAIRTAGGVFWADPVSGCLFVRAPIPTQRLLRQRFNGTANEPVEPTDVNLMPAIEPTAPNEPTVPSETGETSKTDEPMEVPNQDAAEPVPEERGE